MTDIRLPAPATVRSARRNRMRLFDALFIGLVAAALAHGATGSARASEHGTGGSWSVRSPDGSLAFHVRQTERGGLEYRADTRDGRRVLGWSQLGVVTSVVDQTRPDAPVVADFTSTIDFQGAKTGSVDETYRMKTGKRAQNRASASSLALSFSDVETGKGLRIDIRVFDEGFGFRHVLTDESTLMTSLIEEATSFEVGEDGRHWGQPYDFAGVFRPAYETPYVDGVASGTAVSETQGTGWSFPSLFRTGGGVWLLLHESNVGPGDHGSHLKPEAPGGVYEVAFPLEGSALGFGRDITASTLPWTMPWRLGIVSDDLAGIVESNLVFHLSEPSRIRDTRWIKPGLSSWSWWSDHASSRNLEALKRYIDLAAGMGWPYSLVDANWNTIGETAGETAMEELVAYAGERNVSLTFWYNSGGRHNAVTEQPRNVMSDPRRRRAELDKLRRLGVKGIKVDFFQSDKQDVMSLYLDVLEDAADCGIMVVFHGSTIPRGWARTWPNLMSMESVRGAEFYTFPSSPDYGELAPYQNTILAFTRNVIGSMDYTPVSYTPQRTERRTTNGHETALAVLFESGIQHISASAGSLRALPAPYLEYFRNLPAAWDETRFVHGHPGRDAVIARRRGQRWYVAGINGVDEAKTLELDLSFIDPGTKSGVLLHDGEREFAAASLTLDDLSAVPVRMEPYGGFTLILR